MKTNILLGLALTTLIASCSQKPATESRAGVYNMDKQVISDGVKDYTYSSADGTTQIKIYTPSEYFFITNIKDSVAGFGLGSYTQAEGKIEETNIYNTNTLDTIQKVSLNITNNEKGYTQSIPEMMIGGKKLSMTEDYTTIAANGASALDGVWHQSKNLEINGKDTVDRTYNEYKVYHAGHFMWGARYLSDSTKNTYEKIVGHGTFTLNNDALTETLDMSSRKGITGKYNIIVKFNGGDEYTQQTADTSTHIVGFKTYKRVSK